MFLSEEICFLAYVKAFNGALPGAKRDIINGMGEAMLSGHRDSSDIEDFFVKFLESGTALLFFPAICFLIVKEDIKPQTTKALKEFFAIQGNEVFFEDAKDKVNEMKREVNFNLD